jgi:hypothetical protein
MNSLVIAQIDTIWETIDPSLIILAVLILLAAMGLWIYRVRNRALHVNTSDDSLTIHISRSGLQDLLYMACSSYPDVHCTRTKIRIDDENKICPHIYFSLGGHANLIHTQKGLKERIQDTLKTHLGPDQIGNIEFTVSGFRPDTKFLPSSSILETDTDNPLPMHQEKVKHSE